jgi:bifunctional UDP-N-acetylglucosamine pyrophosphorylase/glucosamine-1-phosphate N-acetyltransferase
MLVAPVTVGDEAMTASGSVITEDVPEGRARRGRAKAGQQARARPRLMERLRAIKKERKGLDPCAELSAF